jgi:anti-anti-sigma factor
MQAVTERQGDTLVIAPAGRLDSNSAPEFERELNGHVARGERRVVLDLTQLDYISSAGLRVVLMLVKQLKAQNGRAVLCGMKPAIKEVFDISGFSKILQIVPSRGEALSAP